MFVMGGRWPLDTPKSAWSFQPRHFLEAPLLLMCLNFTVVQDGAHLHSSLSITPIKRIRKAYIDPLMFLTMRNLRIYDMPFVTIGVLPTLDKITLKS